MVGIIFQISQHLRDQQLIEEFINYFNCGRVEKDPRGEVVNYLVSSLNDINNNIISFFNKYSLHGAKLVEYIDFCKVVNLMNNKEHITREGVQKIRDIKEGMNTKRGV
jgi:hypothetical protein